MSHYLHSNNGVSLASLKHNIQWMNIMFINFYLILNKFTKAHLYV